MSHFCYNVDMLKIFYGSETVDRENFIFENTDPDVKTIIIVPDQFSLQMERNALEYYREKTGRTALMNLMIADFSSLGHKAAEEADGPRPELIDRYGRHMLLSVIIDRLAEEGKLGVYENMKGRSSFAANANQLISEMKRYGAGPEDIETAMEDTDSFLKRKLADIGLIFREYENAIADRFTDSEDYMRLYGEYLAGSQLVKDAVVWVYGFDTFTPLNMEILQKILGSCAQMNVVMTWDRGADSEDARVLTTGGGEGLFELTGFVMDSLEEMAEELGIAYKRCGIETSGSRAERVRSIWTDRESASVTLAETSNIYAEADRAAAHVMELVRDRGYRYGDIAVICNDMDVRGAVLQRTFERWGIPVFADRKRRVLHQPVVRFLLSFLDVIAEGFDTDAVAQMASSGLMGWDRNDEDLLGNYIDEAGIRGSRWKKKFTWKGEEDRGKSRYTEDDLARLNSMREYLVEITEKARKDIGKRNTADEKISGLYRFLEEDFEIRNRISGLIDRQLELDLAEGAAETAQSWKMICGLFAQITGIIGGENISNVQLRDILRSGLEEMEIGLVPTSTDCVIIGTLQRTRLSRIRSLVVTSANEGVLPLQSAEKGLLTEKELSVLEDLKLNIAKREEVRMKEEQLAIYRMFSRPSDDLFVTCSLADGEGKSAGPSGIFTALRELDGVSLTGDLGAAETAELITSCKGTAAYAASAMQDFIETGFIDDMWLKVMNWYRENDSLSMDRIRQGISFSSKVEVLEKDLAESLYFGDRESITVSASRLETFSQCPFRHFIARGLAADEPRGFETDGRSRGDVYHDALQKLSSQLMPGGAGSGMAVTDEQSPWMTITEEECRQKIENIIRESTANYREGVYLSDRENMLQLERIIENCGDMAWAMVNQVRKGNVRDMYFEESFGFGGGGSGVLRPVEIELEDGKKALLSGRVDRLDIIDTPRGDAVRIIDYKTGSDKIEIEEIESGYRLQLMMYMNAVEGPVPAGTFYFKIRDLDVNADSQGTPQEKGETVEDRIAKSCRLEGVFVNDEDIIKSMDRTLENDNSGSVISVSRKKDGSLKCASGSEMISREDFERLCRVNSEHVKRICLEMQNGRIDIEPKREKGTTPSGAAKTSCTYCSYKSICLFDTSFRDCRYVKI